MFPGEEEERRHGGRISGSAISSRAASSHHRQHRPELAAEGAGEPEEAMAMMGTAVSAGARDQEGFGQLDGPLRQWSP